jgi:C-terminal peptidase prc
MLKEKIRLILIAMLVSAALFFFLDKGYLIGLSDKPDIQKTLKLMRNLIDLIKEDYVEEPNPSQTMEGAFRGLINSLDVLSSYLNKEGVDRYHRRLDPELSETGVVIYKEYGMLPVVIGIKDNSPAQKSSLKIGESIGALDDKSTLPMSMLEVNLLMKSSDKSPVKMKIVRINESQEMVLERQILSSNSYSFSSNQERLAGILRIHNFFPPVVSKIKEKLLPDLKHQIKPLIIDMRNCHEGDLNEAFRFVNLFIQKNNVGYLEKKDGVKEKIACLEEPELKNIPLVVWTNRATIGPAEAAVNILRDHRKAKVIGRKTPGLAAEQKFFLLDDGSGMVLTSAIFKSISGKKLWYEGISPDIQTGKDADIKSYLEQTYKAISSE